MVCFFLCDDGYYIFIGMKSFREHLEESIDWPAAIMTNDGKIYTGKNHFSAIREYANDVWGKGWEEKYKDARKEDLEDYAWGELSGDTADGFVIDGRFVNRRDAVREWRKHGQAFEGDEEYGLDSDDLEHYTRPTTGIDIG